MGTKQLFLKVCLGAVLVSGVWSLQALQAAEEAVVAEEAVATSQLDGTVVKACPKGCFIKIKTGAGDEVGFLPVVGDANQEIVKALKAGEAVHLTTTTCPKTQKLTVTKVEKAAN